MDILQQFAVILYVLGTAFTCVGAKENGAPFFTAVWLGVFFPVALLIGLTYAGVKEWTK